VRNEKVPTTEFMGEKRKGRGNKLKQIRTERRQGTKRGSWEKNVSQTQGRKKGKSVKMVLVKQPHVEPKTGKKFTEIDQRKPAITGKEHSASHKTRQRIKSEKRERKEKDVRGPL